MKYFISSLLLIFSLSCCQGRSCPPHVKYAYKEISKFRKSAREKYGVVLMGHGGAFRKKINKINLTFYIQKEQSIDEMRDLMVHLANDFLTQINSNDEIRPYLVEYPFRVERLHFGVLIFDSKKKFIVNPANSIEKLAVGRLLNGRLNYSIRNEEQENLQLIYQETFEEALEKVYSEQPQGN